jgi:two-component system, chemotaxis family, CheB/CheR fusion protein
MPPLQNKDKIKEVSANIFPVVGVGASAGGLDAFKQLLRSIPEDSGMAFILVQHLEPTHHSILPELLQRVTKIPVREITQDVRVEPNNIYTIPTNKLLTANDGVLQLTPRPPRNVKNMPIDVFFTSLAEVHQNRAIGVILSGTATDGTIGLKSIKEHGGTTFAQNQQTAAFDGMPQSAVGAEVVDYILSPEEIISQIIKLNEQSGDHLKDDSAQDGAQHEEEFRQLLAVVQTSKRVDFTHYKQATIRRRILRRMALNKTDTMAEYLTLIKKDNGELDRLYQDMLISVTQFFRDPAVFTSLSEHIFPQLLKERGESDPLRIWVAGCSTGEEVYSIAISIYEIILKRGGRARVQIFATDISENSIAKARSGKYSKKEITGLSEERLQKFFTSTKEIFQVNRFIRDMCVFACHNFVKDVPFVKMDFISCRNVLIYMEPYLQKRALTTFHYALKENGFLLLGKSETTGSAAGLFELGNKKGKLYIKKVVARRYTSAYNTINNIGFRENMTPTKEKAGNEDYQKSADEILLSKFSPPGVVVNDLMEIVQFRGSTGKWLAPPAGRASLNVLKMARSGLAFKIRNAFQKANLTNRPVVQEKILMRVGGTNYFVNIEVIPLNTPDPYYLILFKEGQNPSPGFYPVLNKNQQVHAKVTQDDDLLYIKELEHEVSQAREDLKEITDEQEGVNAELQSSNEELLAGSEELQSLNEELETSKEELQSTNEELTTLNQELSDSNEQLNVSRVYAESIVATIREPLIVLNKNMRVRTANPSYYEKFKTTPEKTEGKLFYELAKQQWDITELRDLLEGTLKHRNKIVDFEIKKEFGPMGERHMLLNASRILTEDESEEYILIAIEDITELKQLENGLKKFASQQERLIVSRTFELKNANNLLKHSNENLDQFATVASHDLQEPLRKIITFANLLNLRHSNDIKPEAKELLDKISLSAERMSLLINGVLNFSRVAESQDGHERTNLNEIITNVISDFDLLIAHKKAIISRADLPVIDAIPMQMNQLFHNLLGNALKFSKAGTSPEINITSGLLRAEEIKKYPALSRGKSYCKIIFSDNGIGFDKQFADQIFEIFQRLNPREFFEGTGIGLALCKKIVINHHGEIYAESNNSHGAQFTIILPIGQ